MKATAYIQIVPQRQGDKVTALRIVKLTQSMPRDPEPGALVSRIEVEVDPAVFAVPTMRVEVGGDPSAVSPMVVPVPVPDDTQGAADA